MFAKNTTMPVMRVRSLRRYQERDLYLGLKSSKESVSRLLRTFLLNKPSADADSKVGTEAYFSMVV